MNRDIPLYTPRTIGSRYGRQPLFVSRRECACQLFPTASPAVAVACLHRWIAGDATLQRALVKTGYRPRTKYLSRSTVAVLRRFI